jgi:hypothetical protein
VRRFLVEHPEGTVVALGEGLETQFWRVDNGLVRWDQDRYRPPPWTWGMDAAERRRLAARPGMAALTATRPARGRGLVFGVLLPALERVPALRYRLPVLPVLLARFASKPDAAG